MRTYKTKKAVLKYVKEFMEDYTNWIQGSEFFLVPEGVEKNGPDIKVKLQDQDQQGVSIHNPQEARQHNERCKVCVMGAVKMYSETSELAVSIIRDLDQATDKRGYRCLKDPEREIYEIFEINDGVAHKRPLNAWKATLKIVTDVYEKTKG